MARRVSWTNNSSGHLGTRIYRAPTLDPQNLPAPVATVGPVAQGETAEWVDNSGEYGCYAVQDYDAQGVGALSAEVCVTDPWANVQIGDEIGGGVYAGTHTDGTNTWHVIFATQTAESAVGPEWGNYGTSTGATNPDDGLANQTEILTNHDDGSADAFYHCRDYVDGDGNNDYYLPARNELALVDALVGMSHAEFSTDLSAYRWSSTENSSVNAWTRRFSGSVESTFNKSSTSLRVRPVRRVPV
ncbi:hypothetical protein SAMN04487957_110151 [Halomonas shengliensis]|uniref:DUF1566 domain-containing protein n=1 Tax=Halomonas shengliensis TaxID=419597 RepID=A0A1H0LY69_9GAMM|nr:hypothetical protein [Halomonas shengliensis]SDO73075.1 hypothetical protein SAMN04487957_110151 [Halomonas shengliensis]